MCTMCMCDVSVCIYVSAVSCVVVRGQPWVCIFLFQLCETELSYRFTTMYSQWTGLQASKILLSPAPISLQNHWGCTGLLLCPTLQGSGLHTCTASTWPTKPIYSRNLETQSPVAQAGLALATEWRMTLDSWPSHHHLPRVTVMSYHTQFTTY